MEKPVFPPARLFCDACGELKNGKHTSLLCRFFAWLDRK